MTTSYTDQQRADALARLLLNSGNVKRTAMEMDIPRTTLIAWRDGVRNVSDRQKEIVEDRREVAFAALWAQQQEAVLKRLAELIPTASFRDLSIFAGIAADKHLDYTVGRKGAVINVDNRSVHIDTIDALAALREARQALESPDADTDQDN